VRLWPQIFGHLRRFSVATWRRKAWRDAALAVTARDDPFFLACLQREGDSQLLEHSELKTNRAFMATVIASFAAYADADTRLVFKNHPLDPGVHDLAASCAQIAAAHGVSSRVVFLEGGVFARLATAARGVIAVNSTAAFAALGFGKPVKLLGRAVFDIGALVDSRRLDQFWRDPLAPDMALYARFRRQLTDRTQIWGSFHNPKHLDGTARGVVERIVALDRELPARRGADSHTTVVDLRGRLDARNGQT
jgi:capsular polysaccharide export protein